MCVGQKGCRCVRLLRLLTKCVWWLCWLLQHAIVFVNTKRDADDLVAELGLIIKGTEALHGDIPQVGRRSARVSCVDCAVWSR